MKFKNLWSVLEDLMQKSRLEVCIIFALPLLIHKYNASIVNNNTLILFSWENNGGKQCNGFWIGGFLLNNLVNK